MSTRSMKHLIKEALQKTINEKREMNEILGIFKPKAPASAAKNELPSSPDQWDMRERQHRAAAMKHTEAAHDFDKDGNTKAADSHFKAAEAHRLAHDALYHSDDKEGYKKLANAAHNASREARFTFREPIQESMHDNVHSAFEAIVDRYKNKEADITDRPSAPNTSKFTAPSYGMIQHLQDIQVGREHPFQPHRFDNFIKIGSNVDPQTAFNIKSDVHDYLMDSGHTAVDYNGNPTNNLGKVSSNYIRTVDRNGTPYTVKTVSGTAWGGIGIVKGHE